MPKATLSAIDHDNEGTSTSVGLVALTGANFVAQGVVLEAVRAAVAGVSTLAYEGTMYPAYVSPREEVAPAFEYAQRETKWLVRYQDNVNGRVESFEIGGADLTLLSPNTKTLDTTTPEGTALVDAVNTHVRSIAGNAVTFISAVHVGRNN